MKRLNVLLLSKKESSLTEIAAVLTTKGEFQVTWLAKAEQAWSLLRSDKVDVAVVSDTLQDCSGLDFIKHLTTRNPFVNCALVSSLPHDQFHEVTEGYGVFMQLPVKPTTQSADEMIGQLEKIYQLIN